MAKIGSIGRKKSFKQAVTLKQVGAKPITIKGKQYFRINGGIFTKKEVLRSRLRFAQSKGLKYKKQSVGL